MRWGLGAVLLLATVLRLDGLHWDAHRWEAPGRPVVLEEQHLHPDERFLTMVTEALRWPEGGRGYFDTATSPLNPQNRGFGFYVYGTLPVFLTKAVGDAAGQAGYHRVHIVGRLLSAGFDLLTVLLTFGLGRRLYGPAVGLLGALLLAAAVLPIQLAHFYTVDTFATALVMLALVATARVLEQGRGRDHALLGAALGAALACKVSVAVLGGVAAAAILVRERGRERPDGSRPRIRQWVAKAGGGLGLVLAVALVVFRVLQPYTFRGPGFLGVLPNPAWVEGMRQVGELMSGLHDFPPGHQWTDRTRFWFPWANMVTVGMGPALGLAAWGGWLLAGWEIWWRRERAPGPVLVWAWVLVLFAYQGSQWVASMRYFLPIYPALALFAALLLVRVWCRAREGTGVSGRRRAGRRAAAAGLAVLVVGGTLAWAWAFTSIYRRPHSRIAASRWIYATIPPGAVLAVEHWDDALPLPLFGGASSTVYRSLTLANYAEDTPEKLDQMLAILDQAGYVILSSNRLSDSIPRLPMRYPMTTRYYRELISGELGFRQVAEFTAYPRLLGIEFPDQGAEEAFSVYDHPRVRIFRKTEAWSPARARALLEQEDWEAIPRLGPRDAERLGKALAIDPATREAQRTGGTWSRRLDPQHGLYDPGDLANRWPVLAWALALALLGLLAFPLTALALGTLPDRGFLLAKAVGLLVIGVGAWWLASAGVVRFSAPSVTLVAVAVALASGAAAWWQRDDLRQLWRERRGLLLLEEAFFWLLFAGMLWIRWQNPDLWHPERGGEKPMDLAFLNAVLKSEWFPPYDPWFAGGYLNYYYFGFVLVGTLVKLTGIVPAVAYTLAVPTFFALTGAGAATAAAALVEGLDRRAGGSGPGGGRWAALLGWGSLGALHVVVAGNLLEGPLLAEALWGLGAAGQTAAIPVAGPALQAVRGLYLWLVEQRPLPVPTEYWFWPATRAIPCPVTEPPPITEFPFFTFLFADLHAHLLAMPYVLLVIAGAIHLVADGERPNRPAGPDARLGEVAVLALLGLVTGALWAINAWDFPTALGLVGLGLVLREVGRRGRLDRAGGVAAGVRLVVVGVGGRLLFQPFTSHLAAAYGSLDPWLGSHTPLGAYLGIFGYFLFGVTTYLVLAGRWREGGSGWGWWLRAAGLAGAALLAALGLGLLAALAALGALALPHAVGPGRAPSERLMAGLILLAVGLSAAVELVVLRGDVGRMNTVFKLYLQVWALLGVLAVAGAATACRAWGPSRWTGRLARAWAATWLVLLGGALVYPLLATPARLRHRFDPTLGPGLDGEAYLRRAVVREQGQEIPLAWDAEAIRWLREHVAGSPVVVEASLPPYHWGSRVSIYTGLPTVVGWGPHERQQRAAFPGSPIARRLADVHTIYTTPDVETTLRLLGRYEVQYVYVGPLERLYHGGPGLSKFEALPAYFERVYENPGVRIYRVIDRNAVRRAEGGASPRL
jgi:YYY domain-containing protein